MAVPLKKLYEAMIVSVACALAVGLVAGFFGFIFSEVISVKDKIASTASKADDNFHSIRAASDVLSGELAKLSIVPERVGELEKAVKAQADELRQLREKLTLPGPSKQTIYLPPPFPNQSPRPTSEKDVNFYEWEKDRIADQINKKSGKEE